VGEPTIDVVGLHAGRPVGEVAERALRAATFVAGSADQLAAVADLVDPAAATAVVGGGLGALDRLAAHDGPACVLASGDPGFHGIGRALRARFGADRVVCHPAPSSVAVAFARLGLPWHDAVVATCHTGGAARAAALVAGEPTAAVLCGPAAPPEAVGAALAALGAHPDLVAVATRLGEPGESVIRLPDVAALAAGAFDHRSVVVLAHTSDAAHTGVAPAGRLGGRPVDAFAHRAGMITKPEVRAAVLGHLDLPERGVLWDVGAGSGSVAVEAALAAPGLRVLAVERDPAAAEQVVANAAALGALVEVVTGAAPGALADLPAPDRVFVGGGGLDVLDACLAAAAPGARVVATYAAVDRAVEARARLGSLVQLGVDRAVDLPDGGVRFVADNPVFLAWGDVVAPAGAAGDVVALGIGCSSGATAAEVDAVAAEAIAEAGLEPTVVATVDRRAEHPAVGHRRPLTFGPLLLGSVDVPNPSAAVADAIGTPSVAEAAALLAAGPGARLVVAKRKGATATAAVAVAPARLHPGAVVVVGLGPGGATHRTPAATAALRGADAVVGYGPYVDAVAALLRPEQAVVRSAMGDEAERADAACELARAGWRVAVVSSGDPGVFAMASVVLQRAAAHGVAVSIVPGVTAAHAAGAAAVRPLGGPHAVLTLSDILLPAEVIEAQLRAAAGAGLAIALYNPRSAGRPDHLDRARAVLLEHLPADTPVVLVDDATGTQERVTTSTLADFDATAVGMRTVVLVGPGDPRRPS
jgi:cobalt-precorrin 5A hydrolase/precorrin-3B C17-methyltransferase